MNIQMIQKHIEDKHGPGRSVSHDQATAFSVYAEKQIQELREKGGTFEEYVVDFVSGFGCPKCGAFFELKSSFTRHAKGHAESSSARRQQHPYEPRTKIREKQWNPVAGAGHEQESNKSSTNGNGENERSCFPASGTVHDSPDKWDDHGNGNNQQDSGYDVEN